VDRRAGRDEEGLEELAERLDGMEIDGVKFYAGSPLATGL